MEERISMVHGSGGAATSELIGAIFAKEFASDTLDKMEDSAVVEGAGRIAITMANTVNGMEDVSLYAVASRNVENAAPFAKKYEIQYVFDRPSFENIR